MQMQTYDVVISRVERVQQTRRAPTASKDDQRLLAWVVRELRTRCAILVGDVPESPCASHEREERDFARGGKETLPSRELGGRAEGESAHERKSESCIVSKRCSSTHG